MKGSSFIDVSDSKVVDVLHVLGCDWNYGEYGIRIDGYNHGDNSRGKVLDMRVEGNTIIGAHSQFRERWPNNTYVESMSAYSEREIDRKDRVKAMERELAEELARLEQWLT